MYVTHTFTATPHVSNCSICEVWFTCDIKWVLHAHFTVEFLPYIFEYANELACMINEAYHNADGTPKSRRGVLLYIRVLLVFMEQNGADFYGNASHKSCSFS